MSKVFLVILTIFACDSLACPNILTISLIPLEEVKAVPKAVVFDWDNPLVDSWPKF
jgi:hypothetical protein